VSYEFKVLKLGILTFLFISMVNRFTSMVFVLNFSTSGLNSSVLFTLLFVLAPILYPIIKSNLIKKRSFSFIISILAFIKILLMLNMNAVFTVVLSGLILTIVQLEFMKFTHNETKVLIEGLVVGFSLHITISILMIGIGVFTSLIGNITLLVIIGSWILIEYKLLEYKENFEVDNYNNYKFILAFVTYSIVLISNPFVMNAWIHDSLVSNSILNLLDLNYMMNIPSGILGVFGIFSMYIGLKFKNTLSVLDIKFWNIGYTISMILLIFIREFILIAYMLNWIAAIRILEINFIKSEIQIGWKNIGYTLGILILIFLQAISGHWVFLPSAVHPIIHGFAGAYIFIMGSLIIVNQFKIKGEDENE